MSSKCRFNKKCPLYKDEFTCNHDWDAKTHCGKFRELNEIKNKNINFILGLIFLAAIVMAIGYFIYMGNQIINLANGYYSKTIPFPIDEGAVTFCWFEDAKKKNGTIYFYPACNKYDMTEEKQDHLWEAIEEYLDSK